MKQMSICAFTSLNGSEDSGSEENSSNKSHLGNESPRTPSQSHLIIPKISTQTQDLGCEKNDSVQESPSKENSPKTPSNDRLVVPKVARRLSVKNAKRKFAAKRETTNIKVKKQRTRKNSSPDREFIVSESYESDSSSEDQDEDDSNSSFIGSYKCQICPRSYKNYKSLKRHLNTHLKSGQPEFKCQTCEAAFDQKTDLEKHIRIHDGSRPYQCDECGSTFTQSSALKRHERIHSQLKPFSCDDCGASFSQSSSLKRHQNTHKETQTKAFLCVFCRASFTEKHHLQQHVNSLHGDLPDQEQRRFTCNICLATFSQNSGLWLHKETVHNKNKNYKCDKCSKSFSSQSNLNRHYGQQHLEDDDNSTPLKLFACPVCDEGFSRSVSLKMHSRLHTSEDPYRCQVCSKMFKYKQSLRKHQLSHRCGNRYSCEKCGRKFLSVFLLGLHMRSKSGNCTKLLTTSMFGDRRFKHICRYCNSRHSLSSRLAKHVRKAHPEAEVFTCDVCDKGFIYYLEFRYHRLTHRHIPYQCKTCEVAFPRYKQLYQHLYNHLNSKTSVDTSSPSVDTSSVSNVPADSGDLGKELDTMASCSKTGPENSVRTENSSPSVDTSSVSNVPADTGVLENSFESVPESDLAKELDAVATCSKTRPENSVGTENSSTEAERLKNLKVPEDKFSNLKCRVCRLVFLGKISYARHLMQDHGQKKYMCEKCNKEFDHHRQLCGHMRNSHQPKKSDKIIKPKKAAQFKRGKIEKRKTKAEKLRELKERSKLVEPSKFEKLLRAKVKEAMERTKRMRTYTREKRTGQISVSKYVID